MAELAAGAVSSLLGVIRNEALLLGRVRDDVQFIKEEMESMNSFLAHLASTTPPSGEHDEQVRTWMNQVRVLAQDCNNCIDLYLYRGNPDIQRARGGVLHHLWWIPWFVQKTVAQHRAAIQLRQLKERARDVGERRMRYGVVVPEKAKAAAAAAGQSSSSAKPPAAAGRQHDSPRDRDHEEDGDDGHPVVTAAKTTNQTVIGNVFEERTLDEYFKGKLVEWMDEWIEKVRRTNTGTMSIAVMASEKDQDALALTQETLAVEKAYFHRSIVVDIPAVHLDYSPLRPKEILYYILRELELKKTKPDSQCQAQQQGTDQGQSEEELVAHRWDIYNGKKELISKIRANIQEMKGELEKIKSQIRDYWQLKDNHQQQLQLDLEKTNNFQDQLDKKPLHVLMHLLLESTDAVAAHQNHAGNKAMRKLGTWYDDIIVKTAEKLGNQLSVAAAAARKEEAASTSLYDIQCERVLREVFPKPSNSKRPPQAQEPDIKQATGTTTTMADDQIIEMISKVTEILQELQENNAAEPRGIPEAVFEQKMKELKSGIKEQMKIKWILDKIEDNIEGKIEDNNEDNIEDNFMYHHTLIILRIGETINGSTWEENRYALGLVNLLTENVAAGLIITTTRSTELAEEYCYPRREPIYYSLAGFYHDIVLKLTSQEKNDDNYNPQILRKILEECEPHEFAMKMFAHAMYANPKRSNKQLHKLHDTLRGISEKSFVNITKKVFKFTYMDLPKECKSCLLYLAIFPQGHSIKRSILIGRWVAEGLITQEDWPTSVRHAERCCDALIDRWLLTPGYIGATGKAKTCVVGGPVHGFITNIAKKQHIVGTRLSLHLARHFSIFNNVQLRGSDKIEKFLKRISESSQLSVLKVLDLEDCHCFGRKNQHYFKDICNKLFLLKYLSLRGTDITHLPREINYLHELEVLDIRQTKVPAAATKHVLLLKLKRLLAGGHSDPSPSVTDTSMTNEFSSVSIPYKIEKMVNMEVLTNVKASQNAHELKDIRKLWQLRKLGVVIEDRDNHLMNLLRAISDQHECLQSLSITLPINITEDTPSSQELPDDIKIHLTYTPEVLENLSICGTSKKGQLLPLLSKDGNHLAKVTLSRTLMNQGDLNVLAKLPKLLCLRFRHKAYIRSEFSFNKDELKSLRYVLVEGSNMTKISFERGATPDLEKIVLSFTNIESIVGIEYLQKLKELELNNNNLLSKFDEAKQITKVTLRGTFLRQGDMEMFAKKPNMRCLVLLDNSYVESKLTFNKDVVPKLNLLIVECSHIIGISFTDGSAPKLEKIAWSTKDTVVNLCGMENLPKLKELEFSGDIVPDKVKEDISKHRNKLVLHHNKQRYQDQVKETSPEEDDNARFTFCWKIKD